jgi:hypothetical protein
MKQRKYRIRVRAVLNESWASYFPGMQLSSGPGAVTCLSGSIADQAALHGILNGLRDLNLEIISVLLLEAVGNTPVECRYCATNVRRSAGGF